MEGSWPKNDIRRAFVAGAKWWEFHSTGGTMWNSDRVLAEAEATKRYASQQPDSADCEHEWIEHRTRHHCQKCGTRR